jgi:archaellum component FlaC
MTKKLPTDEKITAFVKRDIERTLDVADTINGRKPLGGKFGVKQKNKAINTTKDFDEFLRDINFMLKNYSTNPNKIEFSVDRLKGNIRDLRKDK